MRAVATHLEHISYIKRVNDIINENGTIPKAETAFFSYIPYEHNRSPLFEITCAYQIFNAWLYGIYIGSIDTILTGLMIHAKAQFLILKNLLAHIIEKSEELYVRSRQCYWSQMNQEVF